MNTPKFTLLFSVAIYGLSGCGPSVGNTETAEETTVTETAMTPNAYPTTGSLDVVDDAFYALIDSNATIEVLTDGHKWSEGPLWVPELEAVLYSDVPMNSIYKWSEEEGKTLYLSPSGYTGSVERGGETGSNGLTINPDGQLALAHHGDRRIALLDAPFDEPTPTYTTVAGDYNGLKFNSPNDLVFAKDGTLFFTDPPYGLEKRMEDPGKEIDFQGVYRMRPGGAVELLDDQISRPNGIALSRDETKLYVANSDPDRAIWMEYQLDENWEITGQEVFYDATASVGEKPGLPDGLKVKSSGHLFATAPGGVMIFTPEGKLLGTIQTGEPTSNCAFDEAEEYLYMTANQHLMRIALK